MTEAEKPLDEHSTFCKCAVCRPDLDRPEQRTRAAHAEAAPAPGLREADYIEIVSACRRGLEKWAKLPHNAKWWKRIDGTPVPNDLLIHIAAEISAALKGASQGKEVRKPTKGFKSDEDANP